jgi:hypothetical protein
MVTNGIERVDFSHHYGTGHPSAVIAPANPTQPPSSVNPNLVWLFYYDSKGWDSYGRTYILKSYDGYHFFRDSAGNLIRTETNFRGVINVKYDYVNRRFIALVDRNNYVYMNYSDNGVTWAWNNPGAPIDEGKYAVATPGYFLSAGTPTFASYADGTLPGVDYTHVIAGEKPEQSPQNNSPPNSHLYLTPVVFRYSN